MHTLPSSLAFLSANSCAFLVASVSSTCLGVRCLLHSLIGKLMNSLYCLIRRARDASSRRSSASSFRYRVILHHHPRMNQTSIQNIRDCKPVTIRN